MTLTIEVEKQKLQRLRRVAEEQGKNLESVVAEFLESLLLKENTPKDVRQKLDKKSIVDQILENTKGVDLSDVTDEKAAYREYLSRKHA